MAAAETAEMAAAEAASAKVTTAAEAATAASERISGNGCASQTRWLRQG
jgi:hypothetical protein